VNQGLSLYVPLKACDHLIRDFDIQKNDLYNLHDHILKFLHLDNQPPQEKEKEKKKFLNELLLLQGNSGSGKSLYGRYLEADLWKKYQENRHSNSIPVFISLPRTFTKNMKNIKEEKENNNNDNNNNRDIIYEALLNKNLDASVITMLKNNATFVFIFDGFDEIKVQYEEIYGSGSSSDNLNFYDCFKLKQWKSCSKNNDNNNNKNKFIVTCRNQVLNDQDITQIFRINDNDNNKIIITATTIDINQVYLAPFSSQMVRTYIENFVKWNKNENENENEKENVEKEEKEEKKKKCYFGILKDMKNRYLVSLVLTN